MTLSQAGKNDGPLDEIAKNTEELTDICARKDPYHDKDMHGSIGQPEDVKESALEVTSGNTVTTMIEQPKPKFTLVDLEDALTRIYTSAICARKAHGHINEINKDIIDYLNDTNSELQSLLGTITKIKNNLDIIEMPSDNNKAITDTINTEKPEFSVCGVNLFENGQLKGTSLYSTVVKARKIRDILNAKFAELRVKHEARIVNYPVY